MLQIAYGRCLPVQRKAQKDAKRSKKVKIDRYRGQGAEIATKPQWLARYGKKHDQMGWKCHPPKPK